MKDQKTLERIQLLHPKLRDEAVELYDEIVASLTGSAICRFAYTLRTFADLVTHEYGLDQADEAMQMSMSPQSGKVVINPWL